MPSADQVPVNNTHSTMRWHKWVVLIAGSTGSALRAVRPPTFTSRRLPDAISLPRKCDGLFVTFALGHHGPGHPRNLVGKRYRARGGFPKLCATATTGRHWPRLDQLTLMAPASLPLRLRATGSPRN